MRQFFILAFLCILIVYFYVYDNQTEVPFSFFKENISNISKIVIKNENVIGFCVNDDGEEIYYSINVPLKHIETLIDVNVVNREYKKDSFIEKYFWVLFFLFFLSFAIYMVNNKLEAMLEKSFGLKINNKDEKKREDTITFSQIGGLSDAKKELEYLIDYLKNEEKYTKHNIEMPKGILFYGPTGNGKTLLARALANESSAEFIHLTGSDFLKIYVGSGTLAVQELFGKIDDFLKQGKKVVVFIDEVDGLAGKREGLNGLNEEARKTLNEFLSQMDGFKRREGFVIIAATNLIEKLDSAFLRRFSHKILIQNPHLLDRLEILKILASKYEGGNELDFELFARIFGGYCSADMANFLNIGMKNAVLNKREVITNLDVITALEQVSMGYVIERVGSPESKIRTAYHEAGHLLCLHYLLKDSLKAYTINIQDRSKTLGYVAYYQIFEESQSKEDFFNRITMALGGRCAELLIFKHSCAGASSDLNFATKMAEAMVRQFGWGVKNNNYVMNEGNQYIISEEARKSMDADIQEILNQAFVSCEKLLTEKMPILIGFATILKEIEVFYLNEIDYIIEELEKDSSEERVAQLIELFLERKKLSADVRFNFER